MKLTLSSVFIAVISLVILNGCTRPPAARTTSAHFITATVPGFPTFNATSTHIYSSGGIGENTKFDGIMVIDSTHTREMELWFLTWGGTTGTFSLDGINRGGLTINGSTDTCIYSVHGTLVITSVSPDVVGTFNFTREDSSIVTGSFNVPTP